MGQHADRNAQFEKIAELKKEYLEAGRPVISIDTKKKELLGNFYRDGVTDWRSACKADPLRGIDRRVKWTHCSWLAMLETFGLQDRGEGCLRWTITDGFGVLIERG